MASTSGTTSFRKPITKLRPQPKLPAALTRAIHIHEDPIPPTVPIPFKLDDKVGDGKTQTNPKPVRIKGNGVKLNLPRIYYASRLKNFGTCRSPHFWEKKPKPFKKEAEIKIFEDEDSTKPALSLGLGKLSALDNLQRNMKKKLNVFLQKKGDVTFVINGLSTTVSRSVADIQKAKIRSHTGKRPQDDPETYPWRELAASFKWLISIDLTLPVVTKHSKAWQNPVKSLRSKADMKKSAKKMGVTIKSLLKLDLSKLRCLPNISELQGSSHVLVPEIMKIMAFSAWQSRDLPNCIYYLSESQNFFIRREILNRHALHFLRKTERCRAKKPPILTPIEEKKDELYTLQSDELYSFGNTESIFQSNLDKLNTEWNIVQITKLFRHKNRFGVSTTKRADTSPIFISAFISANGVRQPFVTFQPPPKGNCGISKQGVLEKLKVLLVKNRKINEGFKGHRTKYWELRSQHNADLKALLDNVEENWLFPWEFLFPGNINDPKVTKSITDLLSSFEVKSSFIISPTMKCVLYKLVENYTMLHKTLRNNLAHFIAFLFDRPEHAFKQMSKDVAKLGSKIICLKRSPTILVLDEGLDVIPWESISCLKTTPVTRVPSISLINCLTVLRKVKKEKYCETIDPDHCGYILNPDGSLKNVEARLSGYFSGVLKWTGMIRQRPKAVDIESFFQSKDIYLYCGHGSGSQFFPDYRIQKMACRAIPLLMGCGSLRYKHNGGPKAVPNSILNSLFSSTCVSAVGFLYEVTDLDCDRVTIGLLEYWAPGAKGNLPSITSFDVNKRRPRERCLANAVLLARDSAMQFMTAAALVQYGIPVSTLDT